MQPRMPKHTNVRELDETFEQMLVQATEALVKSTNPRRCRRVAGLLREFRDAQGSNPTLYEYYRRVVQEAFLDALDQR